MVRSGLGLEISDCENTLPERTDCPGVRPDPRGVAFDPQRNFSKSVDSMYTLITLKFLDSQSESVRNRPGWQFGLCAPFGGS